MVGCSDLTWKDWITGRFKPSGAARRAIYCTWCWTFHRDRLWQFMDWINVGRSGCARPGPGRFVEDYRFDQ